MGFLAKIGVIVGVLGVLLTSWDHNYPAAGWAFSSAMWALAAYLASERN